MMIQDVGAWLASQSTALTVGGTTGTLALGQMLDTQPNTVVALFEQPGLPTAYAFSTGTQATRAYERPGLQALSRSTDPTTAQTRAEIIYDLLDGLTNTTMSTVRYLEFTAEQPPFQAGRDNNERWLWSVNFNVKRDVT